MIHVWHEDHGFRKNQILNKAIAIAAGDYLIFIDGDCIPHKEFVKEHYCNKALKTCLTGRRVNLSESLTNKLTPEKIETIFYTLRHREINPLKLLSLWWSLKNTLKVPG